MRLTIQVGHLYRLAPQMLVERTCGAVPVPAFSCSAERI
nr:MAG TPA: hypothetical protein [Bacteriophage sp.]